MLGMKNTPQSRMVSRLFRLINKFCG